MDRNLVLLLSSGHTVKIELRNDELVDLAPETSARDTVKFVDDFPAITGHGGGEAIVFSYIEDITERDDDGPNDFQRIDTYPPGETL